MDARIRCSKTGRILDKPAAIIVLEMIPIACRTTEDDIVNPIIINR